MRRAADLVAHVGTFRDQEGRAAKRSLRVGVLMRDPVTGAMSVKLDAFPISPGWSGWLAVTNRDEELFRTTGERR